ncbi:Processing alpha glucosidase I [Sporothrix epigloea]|uniref:Mannosyl-oligosaccharide glucosidase n=1 Tax=Sporothrix epigloea TaxID=1892477 RepID=A0ABP0D5T4_9PEZI
MASIRQLAISASLAVAGFAGGGAAQAGDESILFSETARKNNESLLWGPYRPNVYFGVRPRIPQSLVTGLMWGRSDTYNDLQNHIRYTCEQNEGMEGYGWDEFDTRLGGTQTIHDKFNNIDITTTFIKVPGGAHGGSWGARIKGEPRPKLATEDDPTTSVKTMVVFYLAQEEEGAQVSVKDVSGADWDEKGFAGDITFEGASKGLGSFKVVVTQGKGAHPQSDHAYVEERDLEKTTVQSLATLTDYLWQAKQLLFRQLKETVDYVISKYDPTAAPPPWHVYQLSNQPGAGNMHLVQRMYEGAFEFDVLFSSASAGKDLTSDDLTREMRAVSEDFDVHFRKAFQLQAPYNLNKYQKFARSMFSNLIGGIGYFYGHGIADLSFAAAYEEEDEGFWVDAAQARAEHREELDGPHELFTAIPSRPFFPRGFLWDEGFHLLPISDWDMDLTLEIVKSWFNLMNDDGWIAREQILGFEARSKVPTEFQIQYPHYANPPTLFFIVDAFANKLRQAANGTGDGKAAAASVGASNMVDNTALGLEYLRQLYPRLRRQFDWFRSTQFGDIKSYEREAFSKREAYRWRGRTEAHVLTSGLDDYPRPQPPHPGELHVDLMSWMGMMTRSLLNIGELLGTDATTEDAEELRKIQEAISRNLDDLHWSETEGCYCDATVNDYEEHELVCHRGYISLFPLLLGLLEPSNPKVGRLLALLGAEDELFSPHGLRSLSKKSPLYGTAENYWRSPVWMNINYMALVQLQALGSQQGPFRAQAADLYNRLRRNLVDTVYESWKETGFAWEQYNPETGKGQRTQHFTGWTSLVVKMMAMPELDVEAGYTHDEL